MDDAGQIFLTVWNFFSMCFQTMHLWSFLDPKPIFVWGWKWVGQVESSLVRKVEQTDG